MTPSEIDRFFSKLSARLPCPASVILTGAGAGTLLGGVRPTHDLDFELRPARRSFRQGALRQALETAVEEVSRETGIACNFTEDIDHWSSITLLDYRKHARNYKRFGKLSVRLLAPLYWSIGKFGRYLSSDIEDLMFVLTKHKVKPRTLARLLGRALRESPTSNALFLFRRQVEDFFRTYGPRVWKGYASDKAIAAFHQAAGVRP